MDVRQTLQCDRARQEWLDAARLGYQFLIQHGFDSDGRMYFLVTRDGKPLRKRRYFFTETFGAIACAEYAKASGDDSALQRAKNLYQLIIELARNPVRLEPKINPSTRHTKAHAVPMILLATTQELRQIDTDPLYDQVAQEAVVQIVTHFWKPEYPALFETIKQDGTVMLDTVDGRIINPGHAIESAWFLMHEERFRRDDILIKHGLEIIKWALTIGWDQQYGGLLYFVDFAGKPPTRLEWDLKLWWPHTETLYALLLAHQLTGATWYADWYEKVHNWTFGHFPDAEHGEWFGYLRRDGSLLTPLKGSMWKGAFHLPRALLNCAQIL